MPDDTPSAPDAPKDTFYIGLAMAGAISAGAYSAGVFDFLIEALEEWQKAKDEPTRKDTVPSHKVVIPVMSGASAGGVTGAVGMIALADARSGTSVFHNYTQVGAVETRLPLLYEAWVQTPKFVGSVGESDLLGKDDLAGPNPGLRSLLDTTSLEKMVGKATRVEALRTERRAYLSENTHLFLTLTNLRGVPYKIGFISGANEDDKGNKIPESERKVVDPGYQMLNHADRRHFTLKGLGSASFVSKWAEPDRGRELEAVDLGPKGDPEKHKNWERLADAALGTAGFPVGLSAVVINDVTVADYKRRQWTIDSLPDENLKAHNYSLPTDFPEILNSNPLAAVNFVTIDGGMIDNEPFQYARWTLMDKPPEGNPRKAKDADRAVIMIDPFPEAPDYDKKLKMDHDLFTVIQRLIPVFKDQARFKPEELAAALNEDVFSRFLISPRRRSGPTPGSTGHEFGERETDAIACGLLGGFGGFLDEEFRAHDYQLGRLNCYLFLRDHFALPIDENDPGSGSTSNKVLEAGYTGLSPAQRAPFLAKQRAGDPRRYYQIIPLVGPKADTPRVAPTPPIWPRVNETAVDDLVKRAMQRAELILNHLKTQKLKGRIGNWLSGLGWSFWGRGKLEYFLRWTVMTDLIRRDQLQGDTADKPETERLVIAALTNPRYDLRTAPGIAVELELSETAVTSVLVKYDNIVHRQLFPTKGKGQTYTFKARERNQFWTLPYVKEIPAFFAGDLVID
jgi:hypothetical protein